MTRVEESGRVTMEVPAEESGLLLTARDLSVGYAGRRRRVVLSRLSLTIESGQLVVLLGPNGAGKSTLLRTLTGMQPPLAGEVKISGRSLQSLSAKQLARRVGVVLPERVVPGMLSAYDLVALGRYPHTGWSGGRRSRDDEVIRRVMSSVRISHLAKRDVSELSDGERQKVMIARALAQEPRLLILDEPTAFLDLPGRVEVMSLLSQLPHRADSATAVLLSTHDLDLALRTADRVWLLDRRGGMQSGRPLDLLKDGAFEIAFESDELSQYLPRVPLEQVAQS